jgi:hypothetical protein
MAEPVTDFVLVPEWAVTVPNGRILGTVHEAQRGDAVRYLAIDTAGTVIGRGWLPEPAGNGNGHATPEDAARALFQWFLIEVPEYDRERRAAAEGD